jgi:protein arginine kinase activator
MKCQKCEKPATFHITELTEGDVSALHYCADCAEMYLKPTETSEEKSEDLGAALTKHLKIGQTAEELHRLDQKKCPVCEISFYEFRQSGRLGCPYDYEFFYEELNPLIVNIHGETEHKGKRPLEATDLLPQQTEVIRLRREMTDAIEREDYEMASKIRDQINQASEELK